jgi:hypothetical protein
MKALGTGDPAFAEGLLAQIFGASARGDDKFDSKFLFFALAVARSKHSKDELVAMQRAQMAAVHAEAMRAAGRAARADTQLEHESAARTLVQLTRNYSVQLEALKRYCAATEPNVTVQNVSVSDGAQAIVGNVSHGVEGLPEDLAKATLALSDARQPAMEILSEREQPSVPIRVKRAGDSK